MTMLTVYIPNSQKSNLVTKNVPLRNDGAKVKDVRGLLAHMLNVSDPTEFALFSIVDGKGEFPTHQIHCGIFFHFP